MVSYHGKEEQGERVSSGAYPTLFGRVLAEGHTSSVRPGQSIDAIVEV